MTSHPDAAAATDSAAAVVLAVDDLALIATAGFFVPAAIVTGLVVYAVVRDRRRGDSDDEPDGPH